MSKKNLLSYTLPAIITSTLLVVLFVFAWTEPLANPPTLNVDTPLNVGSTCQYKSGALNVGGGFESRGVTFLATQGGNVGIGTTNPGTAKLKVSGGVLDMDGQKITNVADSTDAQDAATKAYVDGAAGEKTMYLTSATFLGNHNCDDVPSGCCALGYHMCRSDEHFGRRIETTGTGRHATWNSITGWTHPIWAGANTCGSWTLTWNNPGVGFLVTWTLEGNSSSPICNTAIRLWCCMD